MIYDQMALTQNPYGDGNASLRICESIKYYFGLTSKMPKFSIHKIIIIEHFVTIKELILQQFE